MSKTLLMKPMSDAELAWVGERFRMLGEPMRLRILETLCQGELAVGEIVERTGASQANISKHLALLASTGIISRRRDGQRILYRVEDPLMLEICALVHGRLVQGTSGASKAKKQ